MKAERLAELEAYYSQNDDLIESHGAVLELIYAIKGQGAELRAAREVLRRTYERLSQDGYDYDGPTLARIREFLTGRRDEVIYP